MDYRTWLISGALLGLTGVALGAFGAHGLAARLAANGRAGTFDTAVQYHLIHAVTLVAIGALSAVFAQANSPGAWHPTTFNLAGGLLTAGTVIFSGALYLLAIFDIRFLGAIAPVGGVLLLAGWAALFVAVLRLPPIQAPFGGY